MSIQLDMSCNTRYWHSIAASQADRPSNPALAKENNTNLQALIAARSAQDRILWAPPEEQNKSSSNTTNQTQTHRAK